MPQVVGIDHLVLSVGDFERSKAFYGKLLGFLGFKFKYDYADMAGWSNGKTLFWIAAADNEGRKRKYRKGDIGFHHYAFELASRKDVDLLGAFLVGNDMNVADPPGELRTQLLRGLFHRSRRHETRRHDLGAAGKTGQAKSQAQDGIGAKAEDRALSAPALRTRRAAASRSVRRPRSGRGAWRHRGRRPPLRSDWRSSGIFPEPSSRRRR
jgi:catechol 2,3-dioxygenase-like lactoylglutathione lyase family enzyme